MDSCVPAFNMAWGRCILAFIQIPDNPVMQKVSGQNWEWKPMHAAARAVYHLSYSEGQKWR